MLAAHAATAGEDSAAFSVLAGEARPPRVLVVRPVRRADSSPPHSLLDPKFSRALDFKLRRLKEKEILQMNLRRPTRHRPRPHLVTASEPDINSKFSATDNFKRRSQPRINTVVRDGDNKMNECVTGWADRRCERPRFITTVRTGEFLLPPPELAELLGLAPLYPAAGRERLVYSYVSRPKPVASRTKRSTAQEVKKELVPNGNIPCAGHTEEEQNGKRLRGHAVFGGVRALVAGVARMRHLVDAPHNTGSVAPNVMHDRRVVRGSTFAAHAQAQGDTSEAARLARTRRRALARRAAAQRLRPGTPPPAPGRRHHPIQTEYYLEELFDKGVEMSVGVQTDLFVDRPATPVYVPAKTGADAHTQIYPGDLFDFDLEVQPILEVLVGKTTEQALAETAQEEELATLREQQRRYRELRDAERAERQRLARQDQRLHQEKERRVAEARAARVAATEARSRAAAAVLVQGYVAELLPAVLSGLRDHGYLMQRVQRGLDDEFMPWLANQVADEIESIITSRDLISEIVREVVEARAALYLAEGEREEAARGGTPPDSVTPPSLSPHEEEDELPHEA